MGSVIDAWPRGLQQKETSWDVV